MESNKQHTTLLKLPSEIRSLIWEYAFGNTHIRLYYNTDINLNYSLHAPKRIFGSECSECEECIRTSHITNRDYDFSHLRTRVVDDMARLPWEFYQRLESLLTCRMIYSEAFSLFQTTMTLHIKMAETLAFIRSSAPAKLREQISRIVLYIHIQDENEMAWYMRLIELHQIFPALNHIAINYHMAAPLGYSELSDAIFMSMPLFDLNAPFNRPLYVSSNQARSKNCTDIINGQLIPSTDPQPGLTIHTAYKKHELLFSSELLGDVGTEDVIDEHTQVIRSLFEDPDYIAAANTFLASDFYHQPWRRYGPFKIPRAEVPNEVLRIRGGRALYSAIEHISHRYERPWFERLQMKRLVELYVDMCAVSKENARGMIERTLETMQGEDKVTKLLHQVIYPGFDGNWDGGE